MLEIPDIFLGWTVDAGSEPTYAEKIRVSPLGMSSADFFPKLTFSKTLTETLSDYGKWSVSSSGPMFCWY